MARTYRSLSGESVFLSDEHLDVAVEIYEELRKNSPSMRVSWKKHQKMLELEGFFESDASENYRSTIKSERRKRGLLPNATKHAEMVSENTLTSIKEAIGEIDYREKAARQTFNSLNRLKRETASEMLIIEVIENAISNLDLSDLNDYPYQETELKGDNVIFATLADLHYGYVGETILNDYSPELAVELLMKYADNLIDMGIKENASRVIIGNMGDLVEGMLRRASAFDTNKNLAQQTVEATRVVIMFLKKLANHFNRVGYCGVAGNHDRISERYKEALHGDNLMFISNAYIEDVMADNKKIDYIASEDLYFNHLDIYGCNILMVHGDNGRVDEKYFAEQSAFLDIDVDVIVSAHLHRYEVKEVGYNKYIVVSGSFKGSDDYSFKLRKNAMRSQAGIIIRPDGEFDIRQIKIG